VANMFIFPTLTKIVIAKNVRKMKKNGNF
jgi:hypothetical protein